LLDSQLITQEDFEREKKTLLGLFVTNKDNNNNKDEAKDDNKDNSTKDSTKDATKDSTKDATKDSTKDATKDKGASTKDKRASTKDKKTQDFAVTPYVDPADASLVWCSMNISFPSASVCPPLLFILLVPPIYFLCSSSSLPSPQINSKFS
jgi:hypothetical protein